ncbi:glycosyltransferase family 4 protein [Lyngbya confervoides]|uniref:Glycosyltransferase family 4 protein n=1 Tax=Lyngbya confervoides BDU141951 TaxID=1574623 RepID=A0ABD4T9Q0_9CYAN|nr:glycosyltransferase family 4 protein [Lyngbya confervoides]MCM1985148.1 glycosyltransferase family 4 protein [Lyngbya confervoides BDU141951]
MQLLFPLTLYPPAVGGAQIHHHFLAQNLQSNGHKVQIITFWDDNRTDWLLGTTVHAHGSSADYVIDGVSVHRMGFNFGEKIRMGAFLPIYYPWMKTAVPFISREIKKRIYDFSLSANLIHNVRIGREHITHASLQLARQRNIPFVFTPVHHPRWVGWRYRVYIDIYRQADAVIALTQAEKATLVELGVDPSRIYVTGIGPVVSDTCFPEEFKSKYKISEPNILFLGQHYSYKGFKHLLDAAPLVWKSYPETQFVFIGPAVQDSEKIFREYSDPRIIRLGRVSMQEKSNALAASTLLCVPSSQESFGGVYTEAWYFGKPVIGCQIPALTHIVNHGVDGYLVRQRPEEIAECIISLLDNPSHASTMGKMGEKKVKEKLTWDKIAAATEAIYQSLM